MMMKFLFIVFSLLYFFQDSAAQINLPAGVEGIKARAFARKQGNQIGLEYQLQQGTSFLKMGNPGSNEIQSAEINRHPTLRFTGRDASIELPLPNDLNLSQASIYLVFQTDDTLEDRALCYLEKNQKTEMLISSQDLGDIESRSFFNLNKRKSASPKILVFEQNKGKDTSIAISRKLVIGQAPFLPETRLEGFVGQFAELLIFDRVLSPEDRQKVETYLALRYGISLEPQPLAAFVNPAGELLHGGPKNQNFGWRIAGIGQDTIAGLVQKFAKSQSQSALISIEAYQFSSFEMSMYWLWGDDNASTRFAEHTAGQPDFIARKWKMLATGSSEKLQTEVRLDTRRADADLPNGKIWWLALDHSGKGRFPIGETDFFPVEKIDGSLAVFEKVNWQCKSTVFGFAAAPSFFVRFSQEQPQCEPPVNGKLTLQAVGGKAPFSYVLENKEKGFLKEWTTEFAIFQVEDIQAGSYVITARDAEGTVFSENFFVENMDAPRAKFAEKYSLPIDGSPLELDASTGFSASEMPGFYWYNEDGFESHFSKISIYNSGTFWLTLDLNGCVSRQKIEVLPAKPDVFRKVILLPNPAPRGRFQLEIGLENAAPITIDIIDAAGRIVATRQSGGADFYLLDFLLDIPAGDYRILVGSQGSRRAIGLIVP